MQTLFARDFTNHSDAELIDDFSYVMDEFAPGSEDTDFTRDLFMGVLKKRAVIDEIIEKAAPEWPLEKINAVDRNIIRLGLYELLFGDYDQVPPKVAINESIELAKQFGGESSGRFVNGVLGAIYKEIGEPGKEQTGKSKNPNEEIDLTSLPIQKKAGAVVYNLDADGEIHLALVHDVFGFWTLSKGSVEEGETPEQAAIREVKEEINIDINIEQVLGETEYIANHPEDGKIRKQVTYHLARAESQTGLKLKETGGLDDAKWFPIMAVIELRMYDDITQLITQSVEILTKQMGDQSIAS